MEIIMYVGKATTDVYLFLSSIYLENWSCFSSLFCHKSSQTFRREGADGLNNEHMPACVRFLFYAL